MAQRYESYKDSGIQWLGEIPEHWGCVLIHRLFDIKAGGDAKPEIYSDIKDEEHPYPVFTNTKSKDDVYAFTSMPTCPSNSITVTGRGEVGHAIYRSVPYDAIIRLLSLTPKNEKVLPLYFAYFIDTVIPFTSDSAAIGQLSAVQIKLKNVCNPPLSEQQAIVSYLDDKCGKIDEWLDKKQKEVEHLQELKQRVIADAVTRGLNPDVKMKATNIPWLPEIPEHWEVKTLRNFLTMFTDKGYGDKQLLSVTREQGVIVRNTDSKEENHNFIPEDLSNYKYVQEGDFVINKMKSWQGSYGVSEHEGIVSPAYFTCKLYGVDKSFFSTAIRSKVYVSFFGRYSKGIRVDQWDLSPIGLKSIPFLLPPLEEQKQIVSYITEKTTKIDTLVANINKEIENIKEYKQRLISDVVTGQIKVC